MKRLLCILLLCCGPAFAHNDEQCKSQGKDLAHLCSEKDLKSGKLDVCHVPPGCPQNEHTICVSPSGAKHHLLQEHGGDYLGPCLPPPDCAGIPGGNTQVDLCGVCNGENACLDCLGVPNGNARLDKCGVCNGSNSCVDCAGVPNGNALPDLCGVCNGTNTCVDCLGIVNGPNLTDLCGVCGGSNSCVDCAGVPNGTGKLDCCGVCNGDGSTCVDKCEVFNLTKIKKSITSDTKSLYTLVNKYGTQASKCDGKVTGKVTERTELAKSLRDQNIQVLLTLQNITKVCHTEFCHKESVLVQIRLLQINIRKLYQLKHQNVKTSLQACCHGGKNCGGNTFSISHQIKSRVDKSISKLPPERCE